MNKLLKIVLIFISMSCSLVPRNTPTNRVRECLNDFLTRDIDPKIALELCERIYRRFR